MLNTIIFKMAPPQCPSPSLPCWATFPEWSFHIFEVTVIDIIILSAILVYIFRNVMTLVQSQGCIWVFAPEHVSLNSHLYRQSLPLSSGHALSNGSSHYTLALHPTFSEFISIHLRWLTSFKFIFVRPVSKCNTDHEDLNFQATPDVLQDCRT